ncbi:hypothetical protein ACNFBT_16625 [Pseudomonas sp. NY15181]|uniref:hypothetical protein n=1 Tax=Pseudomonas sp. NY15181 TaxID=3400349 RepID=UPI003A89F34C
MKHKQAPLRSQRQHRGWPLDFDVLCWIGAIALLLLLIGGKQIFGTWLPGTGAIEYQRSIPQRLDLPATQALAVVNPSRH